MTRRGLYYQSGWCPGEACGLGGESAARARTGKGPRCTTYAVRLRVSSARSDTPIPHRLPGFKHPLTDVGPSLLDSDLLVHTPLRRHEQLLIGRPQRAVGMHRGEDRRGRGPTTLWHRAVRPLAQRCRKHHAVEQRSCTCLRLTNVTSSTHTGITDSVSGSAAMAGCGLRRVHVSDELDWSWTPSHHAVKAPALG